MGRGMVAFRSRDRSACAHWARGRAVLVEGGKGVGGVVLRGEDARGKAAVVLFKCADERAAARSDLCVGCWVIGPLLPGGGANLRTFAMLGGGG